jgi:hypothetical protein
LKLHQSLLIPETISAVIQQQLMPEDQADDCDPSMDDSKLSLSAVIEEIINGTCLDGIVYCLMEGLMSVAGTEWLNLE